MSSKTKLTVSLGQKQLVGLLLAIIALYLFVPQLGVFRHSWQILSRVNTEDLVIATGWSLMTYLAAAATYCLLSSRRLAYFRTVLIQLASMFANRLLPAGIGSIGLNYVYLRANGYKSRQAGSVVAANNLIGFIGHMLLVGLAVWFSPDVVAHLHVPHPHLRGIYAILFAFALLGLVVIASRGSFRQRLKIAVVGLGQQLLAYRNHPERVGAALLTSMSLTLCNCFCLYYCLHAVGITLPLTAVLLILTVGVTAATVTPTPGGVGGVEAGLVAALIVFHVSSADALAAVLAYRFISYWLALVIGLLAFLIVERRSYINLKLKKAFS